MRATQQANRRRSSNPQLPRFVYPNGSGFRALIRSGYKILYLGTFDTPEKASAAAERMARQLRGKLYVPSPQTVTPRAKKAASKRKVAKGRHRPQAGR
jgi:hypothetical protein